MHSPIGSFLLSPDGNRIELVRLGDLKTPSYQRDPMRSSVLVRDHYEAYLFEVITVSRRQDGSLWIIDGLQRRTGLHERITREKDEETADNTLVLARTIEGITVEQEVYLFINLNKGRVRVSAYAIFHAELQAYSKDMTGSTKAELDIMSARKLNEAIRGVRVWTGLDEHEDGYVEPAERGSARTIGCIDWLRKFQRTRNGNSDFIIATAIEIAKRAYGNQKNVLHTAVIGGLCLTLEQIFLGNSTAADQWKGTRDFAERLRKGAPKFSTQYPEGLLAWCRGGRSLGGGHGLPRVAAEAFAGVWNYNRSQAARISFTGEVTFE